MCECSTFWLIKLTLLDLASVADFFTTDITKQVLNVNGELLKALHLVSSIFHTRHHRFAASLVRVIGKKLSVTV